MTLSIAVVKRRQDGKNFLKSWMKLFHGMNGSVIEPYYPKGKRGRPPMGIEKIIRMYLLQIWFNLSDPATEDAVYDSYAMRKFTGIDFMKESVPDETTLCKFRHLLEVNGLNKLFFEAINRAMVQSGHMMKGGTIVDATIIDVPSSAKNARKHAIRRCTRPEKATCGALA